MVCSISGAGECTGLGLVQHRCHDRHHDGCRCGQPAHGVAGNELWTRLWRASRASCGSSYPDEATFECAAHRLDDHVAGCADLGEPSARWSYTDQRWTVGARPYDCRWCPPARCWRLVRWPAGARILADARATMPVGGAHGARRCHAHALFGRGLCRGCHTHRVWPRQCVGPGWLAGEADHDTIRATAPREGVSAWRNAGACGAQSHSLRSRAAEVETRLHAGRGAAAHGSPQRVDRADACTGDCSNRRLAGNLATGGRRVRLECVLRHLERTLRLVVIARPIAIPFVGPAIVSIIVVGTATVIFVPVSSAPTYRIHLDEVTIVIDVNVVARAALTGVEAIR